VSDPFVRRLFLSACRDGHLEAAVLGAETAAVHIEAAGARDRGGAGVSQEALPIDHVITRGNGQRREGAGGIAEVSIARTDRSRVVLDALNPCGPGSPLAPFCPLKSAIVLFESFGGVTALFLICIVPTLLAGGSIAA
jgi:hypothetical protein